ncbi:Uncharacterised protein [Vibrio cholerae]|nr:Uncharacterised protein [Vibrio cholerae]
MQRNCNNDTAHLICDPNFCMSLSTAQEMPFKSITFKDVKCYGPTLV